MNRYILIHRLTGPAILLLLGIVALLAEMHLVHFELFIPLLLILLGGLKLAERMALAGYEYPAQGPQGPYAPPYGTAPYSPSGSGTSTSIVPTHGFDNGNSDIGEGKL